MSATLSAPVATTFDRLSLTVFFAVILHAIIILGVGFTFEDRDSAMFDTMEIILVQKSSREHPDDAKYLAQANQVGGSESDTQERPSAPVSAPLPDIKPELISQARAPEPVPASSGNRTPEKLAVDRELRHKVKIDNSSLEITETDSRQKRPKQDKHARKLDAMAVLEQNLAIASLDAEIKQKLKTIGERPRKKYISANTQEYKYAAYMEAWRSKVERIGNLNYPDKARRQKLSGALVLDVALNPDGGINKIKVRQPSGHKILDDAAIRIVELAAPYAVFPKNIRDEVDVLHITRTWQFLSSGSLRSR